MSSDVLVLLIVAVLALLFALFNAGRLLIVRRHSARTTGTIQTINLIYWAKWATVSHKVGAHTYVSENRIHVPGYAQIGDEVSICYDVNAPERLYQASYRRVGVALMIAVVCGVAACFLA